MSPASPAKQERSRLLGARPTDLEAQRLHAMLEVAFLTAADDGELSEVEIEHLVANLQAWLEAELESEFLEQLFDHLGTQLASEGAAARLGNAAGLLDGEGRRVAYRLACVTALCDLDVRDDELGFLGTVADAFGIPSEEAQATFDELDEAITALGDR